MIKIGDRLPEATFPVLTPEGPATVTLSERTSGRRVVVIGVPGAFTPTCDGRHLPSFVRTKPDFDAKGIDEIICVSVNDAHVMRLWGETSGATDAGITLLADADASFTKALGLNFDNAAVGFYDRSRRYALVAEDGVVTHLQLEKPGECAVSTGEALLEVI
ncbi:peroxiredoxin [Roseibacterium sp. SDUM158017]|uniref:peroxiredoxin n=1 Tax=Roseicyclus salinarum TaxID=3036773 RepID=UPI0024157005|nr:peroxiredoxin [Roseibacterium sp. SDUM158017]MDG4648964.1 peroxiredoxin [Roseibacterium sp. SDUM158017]